MLVSPTVCGDDGRVSHPLTIWLLGDGKPGHENQSLGLVEALGRLRECGVHRIDLAGVGNFWTRRSVARSQAKSLPKPDLIIGAGHATHLSLWRLGRVYGAPSVVLMRPSLPMSCFDLCIAPNHDFNKELKDKRIILTEGAINRVEPGEGSRQGKLILLGGPSKIHGWDADGMIDALGKLEPGDGWLLTDSRRTPDGFTQRVGEAFPALEIHPHTETGPDWLPQNLQQMEEVWVTEDSVSMTYEALSSGAKVGVLPVPRKQKDARVLRGLDRLLKQGRLRTLTEWQEAGHELPEVRPLQEAQRCAQLVLERLGI